MRKDIFIKRTNKIRIVADICKQIHIYIYMEIVLFVLVIRLIRALVIEVTAIVMEWKPERVLSTV